jgi:hypothetical protein
MFQVDVEKVMYGTGVQKPAQAHQRLRENLEARQKKAEQAYQNAIKKAASSAEKPAESAAEAEAEGDKPEANAEAAEGETAASLTPEAEWQLKNKALKALLKDVKKLLKNNPKDLTAKEKKQLRLFRADAKRFLSHPEKSEADPAELIDELQLQMKSHELLRESFEKLDLKESQEHDQAEAAAEAEAEGAQAAAKEETKAQHKQPEVNRERQIEKGLEGLSEEQKTKAKRIMGDASLSREEMRKLAQMLRYDEENPIDDSKPYATPWRPRPYMSAFAFIPRYLEVNPNICAAVYLRHPVARKGMAEVPTPFSYLTSQLTHNWYLERG